MEALYKKLYDKYSNLKAKRISQLDHSNNELEKRLQECLTAGDSYIAQLKGDNAKLRDAIDDLRTEVASLRLSNDQRDGDSQKLLFEERQKNKDLTKEIDKLLKLQQEGKNQIQETDRSQDTRVRKRRRLSGEASNTVLTESQVRKRRRLSGEASNTVLTESQETHVRKHRRLSGEARNIVLTESIPFDTHQAEVPEPSPSHSKEKNYNFDPRQPQCCRSSNDSGSCDCLFQVLVECFTGMKISVVRQSDSAGICALHQSSGYSFELTWLKEAATDETQFLYQVSSLGTLARVAPEWMREAIIFSMSMCPVFFERVSRVIKHL